MGLMAIVVLASMTLNACGQTAINQEKTDTATKNPVDSNQNETKETQQTTEDKKTLEKNTFKEDDQITFKKAEKLASGKVLINYKQALVESTIAAYGGQQDLKFEDIADSYTFYDVGTLKLSPYKGQKLLVMNLECDGPCMNAIVHRFAWDEQSGQLTWLENMSDGEFLPEYFKVLQKKTDSELILNALDLPKSVILPDGKNSMELKQKGTDIYRPKSEMGPNDYNYVDLGKIAFTHEELGNIYFADGAAGCLYVVGPDNVISTYSYDPGLLDESNMVSVKWNNGSDMSYIADEYAQLAHGCGIGASCYFVEEMGDNDLTEIGKTSNGMKIYAAKDSKYIDDLNDQNRDSYVKTSPARVLLTQTYNTYVQMFEYADDYVGEKKTYDQFMRMNPIIYWKDPFGRYAALMRNEVKPPAECGKPVIYLYPEKTSTVTVKVDINEFTKTEPDYGDNGWKVVAEPNGELTNLADGQKYEYLFWEGISDKELSMNGGFVVAKAELENFLKDSLNKLGLNEKETADFMEFWYPKMMDSAEPYVLVSFVGTTEFNKIAPLEISPKPDTLIRVFMYYQPLMSKIKIPEQKLSTLERNGFTVVEWGGTSNEGWQLK